MEVSKRRRDSWIQALSVNRDKATKLQKQTWHRVCSQHFISGKPSALEDETHPDWIPTLHLGYETIKTIRTPESALSLHNRYLGRAKRRRLSASATTTAENQSACATICVTYDDDDEEEIVNDDFGKNLCEALNMESGLNASNQQLSSRAESCVQTWEDLSIQTDFIPVPEKIDVCSQTNFKTYENSQTQTDITIEWINQLEENVKLYKLDEDYIRADETRAAYYTGLPTLTIIIGTFKLLAGHMQPSLTAKITRFQEYLIILLRLRLDLDVKDLAYRFGISPTTVSRVVDKWLEVMSVRLDRLIKWPSRDELHLTMPNSFKLAFGNKVAVIIDCFEIFIERPSSLDARAETWSHYKHHNTMKFLIGVTPQGSISFISDAWGGRSSDKHITEECNILKNLLPGDLILADRGFNIAESVGFFCAEVALPAFTRKKKQLSPKEIGDTRKIANVRIHVERVIGLTRNKFRILQSTIPIDYVHSGNVGEPTKLDKLVKVMEVNGRNRSASMSLKNIFEQCQEKKQAHNRLLEYAKKLYQTTPFTNFVEEFERYLLLALSITDPNPYVNNILEFVSKFALSLFVPVENKENEMNCSQNTDSEESLNSESPPNPFMAKLMKFLIQFYDVTDNSIRLHVCRLLKLLLNDMSTDHVIDDDLFENLTQSLLVCLKDKSVSVRIEAVKALFRLQDPLNKECKVIKQYLFHLKKDPNPLVREAILGCIGTTVVTLDAVFDRTRDEKEKVRKKAYELLADKVHIKALSISKRVRLLKEGLQDRSEVVKETVVSHLVPTWLKMCNGSVENLLRCLDVGSQETEENLNAIKLVLDAVLENETMEKAINNFIKTLNEENVIPAEELNCENAFYWKYLILYLQKLDAESEDNLLDQIQPELIHYCQYLKNYITTADSTWDLNKKLDHQFICEQLLAIGSKYDLTDMAGSQKLNAIVNDILVTGNCGAALVKPLISCIVKTKTDPEERLVMVAEMIFNIREPVLTMEFEITEKERISTKIKIAEITVQLNELRQAQQDFADKSEFDKAQEAKEQIDQLKLEKDKLTKDLMPCTKEVRTERTDSDTLLKCITLVTELMIQAPFKKMSPTLQTLLDTLLVPGLHSPDPAVRKQGVLAVGLCSLINVTVANTYFVVFLQISQMDQPTIQLMALKVIYDLLHMHGVEMFQTENVEDEFNETLLLLQETSRHGEGKTKTVTNIVTILKSHLDSKYDDIRAVSAQGLGKLLLLGHIYSSELLSHLVLLWFNPSTDTNSLLFHFLGVFIPTYATHGRNSRQSFEDAFIPSLLTVLEAPNTSPLSRVNSVHMAKVLLELIQPRDKDVEITLRNEGELDVQESKPHDRIAEKICLEILKDPENYFSNQKWSQILANLFLSSSCLPVHKNIKTLITKINRRVRDKTTLRNIGTFTNIVDAILNSEVTIVDTNTMLESKIESASSEAEPAVEGSTSDSDSPILLSRKKQKSKSRDSQSFGLGTTGRDKLAVVVDSNNRRTSKLSPSHLRLTDSEGDESEKSSVKYTASQKKAKRAKVQVMVSKLTSPEMKKYNVTKSPSGKNEVPTNLVASPNMSTRSQSRAEESFSQLTTRRKSYSHGVELPQNAAFSRQISQESSQKTSSPKNTASQSTISKIFQHTSPVQRLTRSGKSPYQSSFDNSAKSKTVSSSAMSSSQEINSPKDILSTRQTRTSLNSTQFAETNVSNTSNTGSKDTVSSSPTCQGSSISKTIVASKSSTRNVSLIKSKSKGLPATSQTQTKDKHHSTQAIRLTRSRQNSNRSRFTSPSVRQRKSAVPTAPVQGSLLFADSVSTPTTPISAVRKSHRLNSPSSITTIPDSDSDRSAASLLSPHLQSKINLNKKRDLAYNNSPHLPSPKRNRRNKNNQLDEPSFSEEPIPKSKEKVNAKSSTAKKVLICQKFNEASKKTKYLLRLASESSSDERNVSLRSNKSTSPLQLSSSNDSIESSVNEESISKNLRSKKKSRLRSGK